MFIPYINLAYGILLCLSLFASTIQAHTDNSALLFFIVEKNLLHIEMYRVDEFKSALAGLTGAIRKKHRLTTIIFNKTCGTLESVFWSPDEPSLVHITVKHQEELNYYILDWKTLFNESDSAIFNHCVGANCAMNYTDNNERPDRDLALLEEPSCIVSKQPVKHDTVMLHLHFNVPFKSLCSILIPRTISIRQNLAAKLTHEQALQEQLLSMQSSSIEQNVDIVSKKETWLAQVQNALALYVQCLSGTVQQWFGY